jgi:hypothetical protein
VRPKPRKRNARAERLGTAAWVVLSSLTLLAVPVRAQTPSPAPSPAQVVGTLPVGTRLAFILDQPISSATAREGERIRVHLAQPIEVGGLTIARVGTPAVLRVLSASGAKSGDVYGYVDVAFDPLVLPGDVRLPLRPVQSHLEVHVSPGHRSTVAIEDTLSAILVPGAYLFQLARKGRNVVVPAGSEIVAETTATLLVEPGNVLALSTPMPIVGPLETPAITFPVMPLATVQPLGTPPPRPTPSPSLRTP